MRPAFSLGKPSLGWLECGLSLKGPVATEQRLAAYTLYVHVQALGLIGRQGLDNLFGEFELHKTVVSPPCPN